MRALLPMVPMMTACVAVPGTVSIARVGMVPVTLWMSPWSAPATRTTPGQSAALTTSGATWPEAASAKLPVAFVVET